jgi:hypothetical protein
MLKSLVMMVMNVLLTVVIALKVANISLLILNRMKIVQLGLLMNAPKIPNAMMVMLVLIILAVEEAATL